MRRILLTPLKFLTIGTLGAGVAALLAGIWYLQSRPALSIWHTADLDAEFTARSDLDTFAEYLELEERVFAQLDERVYRVAAEGKPTLRYRRGSAIDPASRPTDWNRSYERIAPDARAGALLLHGVSDSPYSLRAVGQFLHASGLTVVGLRLPGHGTAPTALRDFTLEDLVAATRIGIHRIRELVDDRPLYLVGYSTGGALAIDYALTEIADGAQSGVDGIVLVSPAIGVTGAAGFAVWQARIGHLLGLPKLEWNGITPEYDPFKYNSFAINAADVVYRLTRRIRDKIDRAGAAGRLTELPPILAFQSIVDATVSTPALIDDLLARLPPRGDELVLFDIDRSERIEPLLARDPSQDIRTAMSDGGLPFTVSVLTNAHAGTDSIVELKQPAGTTKRTKTRLDLSWPPEVVSLSHVALPFPASDPLYGASPPANPDQLYLGNLSIRGERGLLSIPSSAQLRLRWNPFFDYLERRTLEFMELR